MKIKVYILIFFFINSISYSNEKIAFVDLNFVFNNSSAGKIINKEIQDKSKKINIEFKEFKKKIDDEKKNLISQKNVLSTEEYDKKFIKLESSVKEYNLIIKKKNNELNEFRNKARVEFGKQLAKILEKYSSENSISMIIKKENLLIGKSSLDVTKGILDLFNQDVKKITVK